MATTNSGGSGPKSPDAVVEDKTPESQGEALVTPAKGKRKWLRATGIFPLVSPEKVDGKHATFLPGAPVRVEVTGWVDAQMTAGCLVEAEDPNAD